MKNIKLILNISIKEKEHLFNYCVFMTNLDILELYLVVSKWIMNKFL
jgi:hypothetical protein